jgi:hypothetical protein
MSEQLEVNGYEIPYFYHPYNCGSPDASEAPTERSLEVAIAIDWLDCTGPKEITEIGCVLPHYDVGDHIAIDLFEKHPRAQNVDACDIDYTDKHVIAISTLEHIESHDNRALLQKILDQCKSAYITVPAGFKNHPTAEQSAKNLEQWLLNHHAAIDADVMMFSRKEDLRYWHEVPVTPDHVREYGQDHRNASTVFVIIK